MKNKYLPIVFFSLSLFFVSPPSVEASFLDSVVSFFKNFGKEKKVKEFILSSDIYLAPNGDLDGNGKIDSGETVRFKYSIDNQTENDLTFGTLNTNISRENINFIHNIHGTKNLQNNEDNVVINHIRIPKGLSLEITFDARINYTSKDDLVLSTEPELVDSESKLLEKNNKLEKNVKKISKEQFEKMNGNLLKEKSKENESL